ncbi:MAG: alpha-1,2-fucosyltransferase [Planctomycetota bacterium]
MRFRDETVWIVARKYGQLANRLFLFANLIGAARHYGVELRNPCFAEYADLFPSTRHDLWCRYREHLKETREKTRRTAPSLRSRIALMHAISSGSKWLGRAGILQRRYKVMELKSGESCELLGNAFRDMASSRATLLLRGWLFRSQLVMDHRDAICDFFRLDHANEQLVEKHVRACRQDCDVLVGVHIRRGDYRQFQGGRYFYDDQTYASWMNRIQEQLSPLRVRFLVCSHQDFDEKVYQGLRITRGPGSAITDLYSLAQTDWMIGPPSTFTAWAAYYGLKPRIELQSASEVFDPPTLADFRTAC